MAKLEIKLDGSKVLTAAVDDVVSALEKADQKLAGIATSLNKVDGELKTPTKKLNNLAKGLDKIAKAAPSNSRIDRLSKASVSINELGNTLERINTNDIDKLVELGNSLSKFSTRLNKVKFTKSQLNSIGNLAKAIEDLAIQTKAFTPTRVQSLNDVSKTLKKMGDTIDVLSKAGKIRKGSFNFIGEISNGLGTLTKANINNFDGFIGILNRLTPIMKDLAQSDLKSLRGGIFKDISTMAVELSKVKSINEAPIDAIIKVMNQLATINVNESNTNTLSSFFRSVADVFKQIAVITRSKNNLSSEDSSKLKSVASVVEDLIPVFKTFAQFAQSIGSINIPEKKLQAVGSALRGISGLFRALGNIFSNKDLARQADSINKNKNFISRLFGDTDSISLILDGLGRFSKKLQKSLKNLSDIEGVTKLKSVATALRAISGFIETIQAFSNSANLISKIKIQDNDSRFTKVTKSLNNLVRGTNPLVRSIDGLGLFAKKIAGALRNLDAAPNIARLKSFVEFINSISVFIKTISSIQLPKSSGRIVTLIKGNQRLIKLVDGVIPLVKQLGKAARIISGLRFDVKKVSAVSQFIQGIGKILEAGSNPSFNVQTASKIRQVVNEIAAAIYDGISSPKQNLKFETTGQKNAEEYEEGFKKQLQISSPSRVMIRIGRDITRGLSEGIERGSSAVFSAFKQLGSGIVRAVKTALTPLPLLFKDQLRSIQDFGREVQQQFQNITQGARGFAQGSIRAGVGLLATGGLTGLLTGRASSFVADFDQIIKTIGVFGDVAGNELNQVQDEILAFSAATKFAPAESADAFLGLQKAGLNLQDSLSALPQVGQLAAASNLDLARATDIALRSINGFELSIEDLTRVNNTLVGAADISTSSVEAIGQALSFVAPNANALGVEIEQTSAAIALLADRGIDSTRAGTGLRQLFNSLAAPTAGATDALNELGVSLVNTDGEFVGLENAITQFSAAINSGEYTEAELFSILSDIGDTNAVTALLALTGAAEDGTPIFSEYVDALGEANTASSVASALTNTFKGSLTSLRGSVDVLIIKALQPLLNTIGKPLVDALIKVVNLISGLPPSVLGAVSGVIAFTAALTSLAGVFLIVQGVVVSSLVPALSLVGAVLFAVFNPIQVLAFGAALPLAIATILPSLIIMATTVAAVGAAISLVAFTIAEFGDELIEAFAPSIEKVKTIFDDILEVARNVSIAFDDLRYIFTQLGNTLPSSGFGSELISFASSVNTVVIGAIDKLGDRFKALLAPINEVALAVSAVASVLRFRDFAANNPLAATTQLIGFGGSGQDKGLQSLIDRQSQLTTEIDLVQDNPQKVAELREELEGVNEELDEYKEGLADNSIIQGVLGAADRERENIQALQRELLVARNNAINAFAATGLGGKLLGDTDDPVAAVEAFTDEILNQVNFLSRGIQRAIRVVTGGINDIIDGSFEVGISRIQKGIGIIGTTLISIYENAFGSSIVSVVTNSLLKSGDLAGAFKFLRGILFDKIKNVLSDVFDSAAGFIIEIGSNLGDAIFFSIQFAIARLSPIGLARLLLEFLGIDKLDPLFAAFDNIVRKISNFAAAVIVGFAKLGTGLISIKEFFTDIGLGEVFDIFANDTVFQAGISAVKDGLDSFAESMSSVITTLKEFGDGEGSSDFLSFITNIAIPQSLGGALLVIGTAISALGLALEYGVPLMLSFIDALDEVLSLAIRLDIGGSIIGLVSSLISSIPQDIVSGLINGLSAIPSIVSSFFVSAIQAVKDVLGIASPSKVFQSIGEDILNGLIAGIKGLASSVASAFGGLASTDIGSAIVGSLGLVASALAFLARGAIIAKISTLIGYMGQLFSILRSAAPTVLVVIIALRALEQSLEELVALAVTVGDVFKAIFVGDFGELKSLLPTLFDDLFIAIDALIRGAAVGITDIIGFIGKALGIEEITDAINELVVEIGNLLGEAALLFGDILGASIKALIPILIIAAKALANFFSPENIRNGLDTAASIAATLKLVFSNIIAAITQFATAAAPVIASVIRSVAKGLAALTGFIASVISFIRQAVPAIISGIARFAEIARLGELFTTLFGAVKTLIPALVNVVKALFNIVVVVVSTLFKLGKAIVTNKALMIGLGVVIGALLLPTIIAIAGTLLTVVNVFNKFLRVLEPATDLILNLSEAILALTEGDLSGFATNIGEAFGDIDRIAGGLLAGTIDTITGILSLISKITGFDLSGVTDFLGNIANTFADKGFFETIGTAILEGVLKPLVDLGKRVVGFFKDAYNAVLDFLGIASPSKLFAEIGRNIVLGLVIGVKALAPLVGKALAGIFRFGVAAAKTVGKALIKLFANAVKFVGNLPELTQQLAASFGGLIINALATLRTVAPQAIGFIGSALTSIASSIQNLSRAGLGFVTEAIVGFIQGISDAIFEFTGIDISFFSNALINIVEGLSNFISNVSPLTNIGNIADLIGNIISDPSGALEDAKSFASDILNSIFNGFLAFTNDPAGYITNALGEGVNLAKSIIDSIFGGGTADSGLALADELINNLLAGIVTFLENPQETILAALGEGRNISKEIVNALFSGDDAESINEALDLVFGFLADFVKDPVAGMNLLLDGAQILGTDLIDSIFPEDSVMGQAIKDVMGLWFESAKTLIEAGFPVVNDIGTYLSDVLVDVINLDGVALADKFEAVKEYLGGILDSVKIFFFSAVEGFANAIIGGINRLIEELNDVEVLGQDIFDITELKEIDLTSDLTQQGNDTGKNFVDGITQGLEDGKFKAIEGAGLVAEQIKSQIDTLWGVQSPSLWAIGRGFFFSQGLAIGIEAGEGLVAAAINKLVVRAQMFDGIFRRFANQVGGAMMMAAANVDGGVNRIIASLSRLIGQMQEVIGKARELGGAVASIPSGGGGSSSPILPKFHSGGFTGSNNREFPALLKGSEYVVPSSGAPVIRESGAMEKLLRSATNVMDTISKANTMPQMVAATPLNGGGMVTNNITNNQLIVNVDGQEVSSGRIMDAVKQGLEEAEGNNNFEIEAQNRGTF